MFFQMEASISCSSSYGPSESTKFNLSEFFLAFFVVGSLGLKPRQVGKVRNLASEGPRNLLKDSLPCLSVDVSSAQGAGGLHSYVQVP